MAVEALQLCKTGGLRPVPKKRLPCERQNAGPLDEIVDTQGGSEAGRPPGRQDMIGARHVIAQRFRGIHPQKDRARIPDLREEPAGILHHQFEVLRRETVGQGDCFAEVPCHDRGAEGGKRAGGDALPRQVLQLPCHLGSHSLCKSPIRRQQDGARRLVMFGLGGVNTEIYKDVAFCILPAEDAELEDLMTRIKGYRLLTGYRGQPPRDTKALLAAMKALAIFAGKHPELDQIELNPLLLYEKGLFAVDVRIFSRG